MVYRCEICGKRTSRAELYTDVRDDGKKKNKGECNACAHEGEAFLRSAVEHAAPQLIEALAEISAPGEGNAMTLEDKITKALGCAHYLPKHETFYSCKLGGYAPFDCGSCTSHKDANQLEGILWYSDWLEATGRQPGDDAFQAYQAYVIRQKQEGGK